MDNKMITYYKELPQWAKGVVIVGGLLAIGLTIRGVIKRIRSKADLEKDLKQSKFADKELQDLINSGIKPTLSDSEVQGIIEGLVEAMNGCGTDEAMIYSKFKQLNNEADVKKLISMWGVQYYRPCEASSPISYSRWLFNYKAYGGDISAWLGYDLTKSEVENINKILGSKGIKHRF